MKVEALDTFFECFSYEDIFFDSLDELEPEEFDILLRNAFDSSRKAGLEILKTNGCNYSQEEIIRFLEGLNIKCIAGKWKYNPEQKAFYLSRSYCPYAGDARVCNYVRESVDGFIMGIGDTERYSRHKSIKNGADHICTDVIYDSGYSDLRWDEVPEKIKLSCKPLIKNLEKIKVEIIFNGYSEKILFYTIKDNNKTLNGFRRSFLMDTIKNFFAANLPEIQIVELTPRPVIEGEFL